MALGTSAAHADGREQALGISQTAEVAG